MNDSFIYYCPICGHIISFDSHSTAYIHKCPYCCNFISLCKAAHEYEYYKNKVTNNNNIFCDINDILVEEEVKKQSEFKLYLYKSRTKPSPKEVGTRIKEQKEEYESRIAKSSQQKNQNIPKCPTCGSTDIEKISTTSKVIGATMFGILSKTARSQFKCKNCGYKW